MKVYPVLDIQEGAVVHGRGGQRQSYRPIESELVASAVPADVALALRERFGCSRLYVADLDALGGEGPNREALAALKGHGFELLVDAGVRSARQAEDLIGLGVDEIVAPLETLATPSELREILQRLPARRVVFGLDLKGGRLLAHARAWGMEPLEAARLACDAGAQRLLVLELGRVGSGGGPAHLDLLEELARRLPGVELLAGGGVRSREDIRNLGAIGVGGVLLATALHDGSIESLEGL